MQCGTVVMNESVDGIGGNAILEQRVLPHVGSAETVKEKYLEDRDLLRSRE